jgi:NADH-quinone oxidoreductase subunit F/NADP-reducing hydrogenase subunit HndC
MSAATGRIAKLTHLRQAATRGRRALLPPQPKILVGLGSCGLATGADEVYRAIREEVERHRLPYLVSPTGCIGWCSQEPLVDVQLPGAPRVTYGRVDAQRAREIVRGIAESDFKPRWAIGMLTGYENPLTGARLRYAKQSARLDGVPRYEDLPLFRHQVRWAARNCGVIDPASLDEYIARGGYFALQQALAKMQPQEIIAEVTQAGLRGRGGAGFPTGRKWEAVAQQKATPKCVICNADEGDPGAYMNRTLLESDPHSVLEGMAIGARAMGAAEGVIYVRDEYPLAVTRLRDAIRQAETAGLLGEGIFGSSFSFRIRIVKGAGAFVCGEETALIASIEGRAGEPRQRPPFPAQRGLNGKPTCINNVETWADIPLIVMRGGDWYSRLGTKSSKGTKTFCLVGSVKNPALIEVPLGITLRQVVEEIGGGVPEGHEFKAIQTGGPSGGCIPASQLDLEVDYESLAQAGAIMGSGGMIVMDDTSCMVDIAKYFLGFLADESCGKCFSCREGLRQMHEIVTRITEGEGREEDLPLLEELGWMVRETSLCGLGQTAPNPLLSTLRYFRDEYLAHVKEKRCPAKVCRKLITYRIDPVLCNGCGACVRVCSSTAILGEKKKLHTIDDARCTKCGSCLEVCQPKAVLVE